MGLRLKNLAESTLTAGISTSATTIPVADSTVFPTLDSGDWFPLVLEGANDREIVRCTAIGPSNLIVERGQEGTAPASFAAGDIVSLRITQAVIDAFVLGDDPRLARVATAAGSANAITANLADYASYSDGDVFQIRAVSDSSSATPTLNINDLGSRTIKKPDGEAMENGSIRKGMVMLLSYDASDNAFVLANAAQVDYNASTTKHGLIQIVNENIGYNPNGDGFKAMTQRATSRAIDVAIDTLSQSNLPYIWRDLGKEGNGVLNIVPGNTTQLRAGTAWQYKSITIPNLATFNVGGFGTIVLRATGRVAIGGEVNIAANNPHGFGTVAGPIGGPITSGTSTQPYERGFAGQNLGAYPTEGEILAAILGGVSQYDFRGGRGESTGNERGTNPGRGGLIIVCDDFEMEETAEIKGMFAKAGDTAAQGPGGGGIIVVVSRLFVDRAGARYEAGVEGTMQSAIALKAKSDAGTQDVLDAANGMFFHVNSSTGAVTKVF